MQLTIPYVFVNGTGEENIADGPQVNANFTAVASVLNGNVEEDNVKVGAKILVSNRDYTGTAKIIGAYEFSAFPTVPDASIPDAKLSANVMLKSVYDVAGNGKVDAADDADQLGGQLPSYYSAVTHTHVGGDGELIVESALSLSDVTTGNVSIEKHGLCPKAPDNIAQFLRGDGAWATLPPTAGYTIPILAGLWANPVDNSMNPLGGTMQPPGGGSGNHRMYITKGGTIKVAYLFWRATGTAGTGEAIAAYIRKNNEGSNILISSVSSIEATKVFSNDQLDISVVKGDYIEIIISTPVWATNPTDVYLGGQVYVE